MFRICILDDYEYSSLSGNIYCTFYIQYGNIYLPDREWTDFPVAVLRMWSEILLEISLNREATFSLYFLDGPYKITCKKYNKEIEMAFFKDEDLINCITLNFKVLIETIYNTSISIVKKIKDMKYETVTDLQELEKVSNEIRDYIKSNAKLG